MKQRRGETCLKLLSKSISIKFWMLKLQIAVSETTLSFSLLLTTAYLGSVGVLPSPGLDFPF
jgi:hypothetical protein